MDKGGKARVIPIRTAEQRAVLNRARQLAGLGALIPPDRNYIQQLRLYEGQTLRAGLCGMHWGATIKRGNTPAILIDAVHPVVSAVGRRREDRDQENAVVVRQSRPAARSLSAGARGDRQVLG